MPALKLVLSTTEPLLAIDEIMKSGIDLVFLDIQMPKLTGIQFMKIIQGKCKVILTTAYSEYALEGFEHDAIDYLLKPIPFERFYKAVKKAEHYFQNALPQKEEPMLNHTRQEQDFIFVKTEYKLIKINLDEILYVEEPQKNRRTTFQKEICQGP
eukprot:gene11786-13746_t